MGLALSRFINIFVPLSSRPESAEGYHLAVSTSSILKASSRSFFHHSGDLIIGGFRVGIFAPGPRYLCVRDDMMCLYEGFIIGFGEKSMVSFPAY